LFLIGGTSYEPPLTNVFTMQWFLTLFSTCLPRETVLRVWDLILLEGNEVLLRTALAIWTQLEESVFILDFSNLLYFIEYNVHTSIVRTLILQ
jgi:Rab-GTPase-TBC domain